MQGEVLCAHNGTQHHQMHKTAPHSSEQLLRSLLWRSRTRNDPSDDGSAIAHARTAPYKPHLPSFAQLCTMTTQIEALAHRYVRTWVSLTVRVHVALAHRATTSQASGSKPLPPRLVSVAIFIAGRRSGWLIAFW